MAPAAVPRGWGRDPVPRGQRPGSLAPWSRLGGPFGESISEALRKLFGTSAWVFSAVQP